MKNTIENTIPIMRSTNHHLVVVQHGYRMNRGRRLTSSVSSLSSSSQWGYSLCMIVLSWIGMMTTMMGSSSVGVVQAANTSGGDKKHVFFLAGPHYTGTNSINSFFLERASNYNNEQISKHTSFEHWNWPNIVDNPKVQSTMTSNNVQPWNAFDLLVTNPLDDQLQSKIEQIISDTYHQESEKGIIIGSAMLDRVGGSTTSYDTHYQALGSIKRVITRINDHQTKPGEKLNNDQVTFVINYRTPRVQQWLTLWKMNTNGNENHGDEDYTPYICAEKDSKTYNQLLELLMTAMNPLYVAYSYLNEGYNVVVVDTGGVDDAKRELPHVIACDAIGVECNDAGKVKGLWNVKPRLNQTNQNIPDVLSEHHMDEIETWLRYRDCVYQQFVMDKLVEASGQQQSSSSPPFRVVLQDSLWKECDRTKIQLYNAMVGNPKDLFNRIRAQMDCNDYPPISEADYASGKKDMPELPSSLSATTGTSWGGGGSSGGGSGGSTTHNNGSDNDSIWKGDGNNDVNDSIWKGDGSSGGSSINNNGFDNSHNDNDIKSAEEEDEEDPLDWMNEESLVKIGPKPTKKKLGAAIEIPMFLFITIIAGVIQFVRIERERQKVVSEQLFQYRQERRMQQEDLHFAATKPPSFSSAPAGPLSSSSRMGGRGGGPASSRKQRRRRYQDRLHHQQQQQQQKEEEVVEMQRTNDEYGDEDNNDDDGLDFLQAYGSSPA